MTIEMLVWRTLQKSYIFSRRLSLSLIQIAPCNWEIISNAWGNCLCVTYQKIVVFCLIGTKCVMESGYSWIFIWDHLFSTCENFSQKTNINVSFLKDFAYVPNEWPLWCLEFRGIFRTQSNIEDGAFCKNSSRPLESITESCLLITMYNLGQKVGDKFAKLSKIGFSMECFTAAFLRFLLKNLKI